MNQFDHGLGVIGLAVLATVMAVLLTAGIPIVLSPDSVKISDWLGFAGNVLGSGTGLVAAIIAWRAVQKQIRAQEVIANRQLATAAMEVLIRQGELLELESVLISDVRLLLKFVKIRLDIYFEPHLSNYRAAIPALAAKVQPFVEDVAKFRKEMDQTNTRRWIAPHAYVERVDVKGGLLRVDHQLDRLTRLATAVKSTLDDDEEMLRAKFEELALADALETAIARCDLYSERLAKASQTHGAHTARARREVGL